MHVNAPGMKKPFLFDINMKMKKKYLLAILTVMLSFGCVSAQSKMSAYTRLCINRHKAAVAQLAPGIKRAAAAVRDSIDTFLKLNDGQGVDEIERCGVRVVNRFGQLLTVRMAVKDAEQVSQLPSVQDIDRHGRSHASVQ